MSVRCSLVRVEGHGSITLVYPLTESAAAWLRENVSEEALWWGQALVVEPRYLENLVHGLSEALGV